MGDSSEAINFDARQNKSKLISKNKFLNSKARMKGFQIQKDLSPSSFVSAFFWPRAVPRFIQKCILGISTLHYFIILLYFQFELLNLTESDVFLRYLHKLFKALSFSNIFGLRSSNPVDNFMIAVVTAYSAIILLIFGYAFMTRALQSKFIRIQRQILFVVSQFHLNVGFWILTSYLIKAFSIIMQEEAEEKTGRKKSLAVYYVFLVIIHYTGGFLIALWSYEPPSSRNLLSCYTSHHQVIIFVSKGLALPVLAIGSSSDMVNWYFAVSTLVISLIRMANLLLRFPYCNYFTMKIFGVFNVLSISLAIVNMIVLGSKRQFRSRYVEEKSVLTLLYTELLLGALIIKFFTIYFEKMVQKFFSQDIKMIKHEADVFKKLVALNYIFEEAKVYLSNEKIDISTLRLKGLLSLVPNISESQFAENPEDLVNAVKFELLTFAIQKLRPNSNFKVLLAWHLIQSQNRLPLAVNYLFEALHSKGANQRIARHLIRVCEWELENRFLKEGETGLIDIKSLVEFEKISHDFSELVHSSVKKYLVFWNRYDSSSAHIMSLFRISGEVEEKSVFIQKFWAKNIETKKMHASSLSMLYSCYLRIVRNDPIRAVKIASKQTNIDKLFFLNQEDPLNKDNLFSYKNIILNISLNKSNIGKILHVSSNITEYLGWMQDDLVRKNSDLLMLPAMREEYNKFLKRLTEEDPGNLILKDNIDIFVRTKAGYIKFGFLSMAINPSLEHGLTCLLILRLRKTNDHKIVLNDGGAIEGISYNIAKKLNIFQKQKPMFRDFCKPLHKERFDEYFDSFKGLETGVVETGTVSFKLDLTCLDESNDKVWKEESQVFRYQAALTKKSFFNVVSFVLALEYNKEDLDLKDISDDMDSWMLMEEKPQGGKLKKNKSTLKGREDGEISLEIPEEINTYHLTTTQEFQTLRNLLTSPRDHGQDDFNRMTHGDEMSPKTPEERRDQRVAVPLISSLSEESRTDVKEHHGMNMAINNSIQVNTSSYDQKNVSGAVIAKGAYSVPNEPGMKTLTCLFLVLCLTSCCLLLVFENQNKATIRNIGQNTLIASNLSRQLTNLLLHDNWVFRYTLLYKKLWIPNQYGFVDTRSLYVSTPPHFPRTNGAIIPINNGLRNSMEQIDKKFQSEFFRKILINFPESDKPMEGSIFDLTDQVVAAAGRLATFPIYEIYPNNTNCEFILQNTMNNFLILGEDLVDVVLQNSDEKMKDLKNLLLYFNFTVGFLSIILVVFFISVVIRFVRSRNKFLNAFLRLDQKLLNAHTKLAEELREVIEKNNMDGRRIRDGDVNLKTHRTPHHPRESRTHQRRTANKIGINKKLIIITIAGIILNIVLFIGFVIEFPMLSSQNDKFTHMTSLIINSDLIQYQITFLNLQTLMFIALNDSSTVTVRNLRISENWQISYDVVNGMINQYIDLTKENLESSGDSTTLKYLTGDLCSLLPPYSPQIFAFCPQALYGAAPQGLIQLINIVLLTLKNAKQNFERTARTYNDSKNFLTNYDVLQADFMANLYSAGAFSAISDSIRSQIIESSETLNHTSSILVTWTILYLLFGVSGWSTIQYIFYKNAIKWRKIIRLVPIPAIENNKVLQTYIFAQLSKSGYSLLDI